MTRVGRLILTVAAAFAIGTALAACGGGQGAGSSAPDSSWREIRLDARGQTVRWWMFGGDERINRYVDERVVLAANQRGIKLERVPVGDTADAVQRVVAQRRSGKTSGGAVDLIWINGENFAAGKKADLWLKDWAQRLPNARFVDRSDPSITRDFGVPVDGQESPWNRAAFVFAHDTERVTEAPKSFDDLLAWARRNPGRFTYPAPPDFTGSAFVRQVIAVKGEDEAFRFLRKLKPLMWREGETFPKSEAELTRLFGDGQVDFALSYDANFVLSAVRRGQVPRSTRPFVMEGGTLQNVSFVTIPADAKNRAGAQVVADLLLDPELQAVKADPAVLGAPTVLDVPRLPADVRQRFRTRGTSPHLLEDLGSPREELPASEVPELERRWQREILDG